MRRFLLLIALMSVISVANAGLVVERELDPGPGFSAYLVSYESDGLKLHAMVAVPDTTMPATGFPVVIANHGYVPDPQRYGFTAEGTDSRPGDYYRSVPRLFTSRGFLVVMPDYRGHNNSEGFDQIRGRNSESVLLYAYDVAALLLRIGDVEEADADRVFMWSHSMGGPVSLLAHLETGIVKAASYWSTMPIGRYADRLAALKIPVMIQHGNADQSTDIRNSIAFRDALIRAGREYAFYEYETADHFFTGETAELAADRDAVFFETALKN